MNVFIVGALPPQLPSEIEIVGNKKVIFAATVKKTINQIKKLQSEARWADAKMLLFTETPIIVTAALIEMDSEYGIPSPVKIGGLCYIKNEWVIIPLIQGNL